MRYVIAFLATLLLIQPVSAQAGRYPSRGSMTRLLQQRQQQLQTLQKAAAEQQAKSIAAQQAAEQHRRDMHKQAGDARREKEKASRDRAIARRKAETKAPQPRDNPMATPVKPPASSTGSTQKPAAANSSAKP